MGNSHANFFSNSHPGLIGWGDCTRYSELGWKGTRSDYFISYSANFHNPHYRHVLAHKFVDRHFSFIINALNQVEMTEEDMVMLIVGEIDCRWHIPKQVDIQNRPIRDVVEEWINDFFPAFVHLKNNGYNVIGWGGQPSTTAGHNNDPENPVYGTCLHRNEISLVWNDLLEKRCRDNNMKFVSIIKQLINPDGLTKMEYYMDYCHLIQAAMPMVIEACKKEGVI
jgi:hypothetical protein